MVNFCISECYALIGLYATRAYLRLSLPNDGHYRSDFQQSEIWIVWLQVKPVLIL